MGELCINWFFPLCSWRSIMIILVIIFVGAVLFCYSNGMELVLLPKVPQASSHCFDEFSLDHSTR